MEVKINNQNKILPEASTLQQLLDQVTPEMQKGIAVAVNNSVIPKAHWQTHLIQPNDDVLIIKATQGG